MKKSLEAKIIKAEELADYNIYIFIATTQKNFLITDDAVKVKVVNEETGVAYYYKEENVPLLWRFKRSNGWAEETAKIYVIAYNGISSQEAKSIVDSINSYNGVDYLERSLRKSIYDLVKNSVDIEIPKLNSQYVYKNMKTIEDKMKKLADLSNIKFHEFLDQAMEMRLDIVKSLDVKKNVEEKGFKFHGVVKAFKVVEKNTDGIETVKSRLKTTFTSNKADLYVDITSKEAIKKAVSNLVTKGVIPIRFEHGTDDFGVWDTFKTYEKDGVFYGEAEGELDMNLTRSQDLWTEIYTYGKEFATSYGGHWIEFHYHYDDTTNEALRVFDEIEIEEISLTTRPANPDTALEAVTKYAKKLEETIDDSSLNKFITNKSMEVKEIKKDTTVAPTEVKPVETPTETVTPTEPVNPEATVTEPVVETPVAPAPVADPAPKVEETTEAEKAYIAKLEELNKSYTDTITSLSKRVGVLEGKPVEPKAVIKNANGEVVEDMAEVEKDFKEKFPMMYAVAKAQGRFNVEAE